MPLPIGLNGKMLNFGHLLKAIYYAASNHCFGEQDRGFNH